jgi:hypothetical protein
MKVTLEIVADTWRHAYGKYDRATDTATIHFDGLKRFVEAIVGFALLPDGQTKQDALASLLLENRNLREEAARLQSAIPEWLCDKCNTVFPPPDRLFNIICKCGGCLHPSSHNERTLEDKLKACQAKLLAYESMQ